MVEKLKQYDAGLLNGFGGGDVGWWHDYLRAELDWAHEFYCDQFADSERPEDTAEQFIQAAIDNGPEPLRRLGEWLANKLDDDDWKTADRLITGAAVAHAEAIAQFVRVSDTAIAAWNRRPSDREVLEVLEPFAAFAQNVDDDGWTSSIHRENISTWFGPSDFRAARALAERMQERPAHD